MATPRRKVDRQAKRIIDPISNRVTDEKTRGRLAADLAQAWHAAWVILLAAIVSGIVAAGLTWVVVRTLSILSSIDSDARQWHALGLGPAALLSVLSLLDRGDARHARREVSRRASRVVEQVSHVHSRLGDGWVAGFFAAVYMPWGFHWLPDRAYSAHSTGAACSPGLRRRCSA